MMDYEKYTRLFGLIGYPLSHSFSKKYFGEKFADLGIADAFYELFPIASIEALPKLIAVHPNLVGLNVTIPYKEQVIPYLDGLDHAAAKIGAVNTIKIEDGHLTGYNTDVYGFGYALEKVMDVQDLPLKKALILGTGGAAKAVDYQLKQMGISPTFVSRKALNDGYTYSDLSGEILADHLLIVNTTPLGMSPKIEACPDIPYECLSDQHLLYDLVYNPAETLFMKKGMAQGAKVINGLEMLVQQAEKAWEIWNDR